MGLNTLTTVLEKKGPEYVDKFLSEDLIITEKLDTYRILFENVNGELKFFKKDNSEITLVDRTLSDIWENAIAEIPILAGDIKLPEGIRFGVAYTPVERPVRIPYYNLPSYILTDVTKREKNKIVEVYDYDEVKNWASLFHMGRPPIIFEGQLTKRQKEILLAYDKNEYFGMDEGFAGMIKKYIGETYSGEDTIEGIILKGGDQIAQVVSYEFRLLDEAYKNSVESHNSRDLYDLVLLSLNEFMDSYRFPILEVQNHDQTYINIICDIFNQYCDSQHISESLDPKYLTPPAYGYVGDLNTKFIRNQKTLDILKKGEIYESILKVFLSSMKKYKKEYGLINESAAAKFNTFVYMINEYSNGNDLSSTGIDSINYVGDEEIINEKRSENIVVKAFDQKRSTDVDNMRVIASVQKAFDPKELKIKKGLDPCVIYVTDMVPFTKNQMENLYAINRSWKVPVLIATVGSSRRVKGEKFIFSDSLLKAQMDSIKVFNKDIVPNYFLLDSWDLNEVFQYSRPDYEPIALITDQGKKSDFIIQLYFEDEVMGGRIGAEPEFNIGEMEVDDKLKAKRYIEEGLLSFFKELTPQAVWGLFDSMVSEYKTWSGQIPVPSAQGNPTALWGKIKD